MKATRIANGSTKILPPEQAALLLRALQTRFETHMNRHRNLTWEQVQSRLAVGSGKLWSLHEMERTGGEPDVVGYDAESGEYIFFDCAAESPKGRRSFCFDRAALASRKQNKPVNNVVDVAAEMGVELLSEDQYRALQELGEFDTKTSSWIQTPSRIRNLGGALFCDRRYDTVFVYHNGAESYYAARGFRCGLKV